MDKNHIKNAGSIAFHVNKNNYYIIFLWWPEKGRCYEDTVEYKLVVAVTPKKYSSSAKD